MRTSYLLDFVPLSENERKRKKIDKYFDLDRELKKVENKDDCDTYSSWNTRNTS